MVSYWTGTISPNTGDVLQRFTVAHRGIELGAHIWPYLSCIDAQTAQPEVELGVEF